MAIARDADLVPGGQPLDVRWKVILADHGYAAAEDRLHQQAVGARGARAIDGRDLDDEIVYAVLRFTLGHTGLPSAACGQ